MITQSQREDIQVAMDMLRTQVESHIELEPTHFTDIEVNKMAESALLYINDFFNELVKILNHDK